MAWKSVRLSALLGFTIQFNTGWVIIIALITWSLSDGFFPSYYKGVSPATYWIMGCAGTVGFLVSLLLHELGHLLVSRRFGLRINRITLFVFGGVTEIDDDPPHATAEFCIAVAGPLTSFCIALLWLASASLTGIAGWRVSPYTAVFHYLGIMNSVLALFNLIPAFPLDGGRIVRATLWQWKRNLQWATEQAAKTGTAFGVVLMAWGIITIFSGSPVSGIWWLLLGQFLRNAAHESYRIMAIRFYFKGAQVGRFMMARPVLLPSSTTLEQLVKHYFGKYRFKVFPVETSRGARCVAIQAAKTVPRRQWRFHAVDKFAISCPSRSVIVIDEDILKAYMMMSRSGNPSLIVLGRDGNFAGIVTLAELKRFLALKLYLDGGRVPGGLERDGNGR